MKSILFSLFLCPFILFAQYKTCDTKKNVSACFWQYSTYSNYAGYYFNVTNTRDAAIDLHITCSEINCDTIVSIAAGETKSLQLGYDYVAAGNPYIVGLVFYFTALPGSSSMWVQTNDYYLTGTASLNRIETKKNISPNQTKTAKLNERYKRFYCDRK